MLVSDRRWWFASLLGLGLLSPLGAVPAVLTALSATDAQWQLREAAAWPVDQTLAVEPGGWRVIVVGQSRTILKTRLTDQAAREKLYLGGQWELSPAAAAAQPLEAVEPAPTATGTVIGIHGAQVLIQGEVPPDPNGPTHLVGQPQTTLRWSGTQGRNWFATAPVPLALGDRVAYVPAAATDAATPPAPPAAPRDLDPYGAGTVVPGDDPLYDRFAALAAAGCVMDATSRQFRGSSDALYTRGQFADFVAVIARQLLDRDRLWPVQECSAGLAAQVHLLLDDFTDELAARGIDAAAACAALKSPHGSAGYTGFFTGQALARVQSGDDALFGQVAASYHGEWAGRLQFDAKVQARSAETLADEYDRTNLVTLHAAYDLSRHLTIGAGRLSTRFGPGHSDLLWSDYAKPQDQVSLRWRTKLFGRPFELRQHTGTFDQGGRKYVTVRRYEYGAVDNLTLALNFGLITDQSGQALASMVLPLYATRFVSGSASVGGDGNFLGSFDAAWQLNPQWQFYGQFFADEFDFSPSPPATAQRIGLLGGVLYTPSWALPGTSYRLEGTLIPDQGTYIGQQNVGLAWLRDGYLFGHPYGQDAAGLRFDARHRFTPRWDVALRGEYFRQLRSFPVDASRVRFDVSTWYDLNNWLSIGVGGRYFDDRDIGGVAGNNQQETAVFVESQAGF